MKLIMLMVLFSTASEPAPHVEHGYGPRPMKSMETCLHRRGQMQAYLDANSHGRTHAKAFCVEFHAQGYSEALDAFKRSLGDPS